MDHLLKSIYIYSSPGIIFLHCGSRLIIASLLRNSIRLDDSISDTLLSLYLSIICSFVLSFIQQVCA